MSLLGPENQESFTSIRQQANLKTRELEQEIKANSKSKRFWTVFLVIILIGWSIFFLLSKS